MPTKRNVPDYLIQATADALLRFPDIPDDARIQFESLLSGEFTCNSLNIWHIVAHNITFKQCPWLWLIDITEDDNYAVRDVRNYYAELKSYEPCP